MNEKSINDIYNFIYHLKQMKKVGNFSVQSTISQWKSKDFLLSGLDQCRLTETLNQMSNQCHMSVLGRNLILSVAYKEICWVHIAVCRLVSLVLL